MVTLSHLVILPVLLPLAAAIATLLMGDRSRGFNIGFNLFTAGISVVIAATLVAKVSGPGASDVLSYPLGNWPVPFGIVLVADPLSALMVLTTSILGLAAMGFATARWHKSGPSFFPLFQTLLMGLNGAFLTGDIFNLFVFFEVLLAASYGLVLHGSGPVRVKAAMHYIAVNLVASFMFLIGAALIYGTTGTLNMADLARIIPTIAAEDRGLFHAGAGILGVAFLIKAGMWPLSFWLPATYSVAAAPVAAVFAVMTKVGAYVVLRLSLLLFGAGGGESAGFGHQVLFFGGLATIVFASFGALASQGAARQASYLVMVSSGTLLAAIGYQQQGVTAGALLYLVSSTFATGALFLLVELIGRVRIAGADVLAVTMEMYGEEEEELDEDEEVGVTVTATIALLGASFAVCAVLLAGLPPFTGFLAKVAMLSSALQSGGTPPAEAWWFTGVLVVSGLLVMIAMVRSGINSFWATVVEGPVSVRLIEIMPIMVLLGLCVMMTIFAGPVMDYLSGTAALIHDPSAYVERVLNTPLVVAPTVEVLP